MNDQHLIRPDVPSRFLGNLGRAIESLRAMKPDEFAVVREKANSGDASSEATLCLAYRVGQFVEQDAAQARAWCGKGADHGNLLAIEELGMTYFNGPGDTDSRQAISWLVRAAALGSASAMHTLGTIYVNGMGVRQDFAQARRWYQQSSDAGFSLADHDLGIVYLLGQGVRVDPKQAIERLTKAANAGVPDSVLLLGLIYQGWFPSIRPDAMAALQWFQKGAALGDVRCQNELGWIYANGFGAERDFSEAIRWYRASAEQNDPVGAYGLGVRYMTGQGVARDLSEAMKWFEKAATLGHADAAFNLGMILANELPGRTEPPDFISAAKYLSIAANQGISDGQCLLGLLYAKGYGVPRDDVIAYEWIFLSLGGTHKCDRDRVALQSRMTSEQLTEARRRAAEFTPLPPRFNYGTSVPR